MKQLKRWDVILSVVVMATTLNGCDSGGDIPIGRLIKHRSAPEGLTVTVITDKKVYRLGEKVRITISVYNPNAREVQIPERPGAPYFGFIIAQNERVVLYWNQSIYPPGGQVGENRWEPKETKRFTYIAPQEPNSFLPKGNYTVYAGYIGYEPYEVVSGGIVIRIQ